MLIDHPEQGRDLALNYAGYFTHPSARSLFTDLASEIDRYAGEYRAIADGARQEGDAGEVGVGAGGKHA